MADIDRPLMSLDASGAFGGAIIFFRLRGARHARSYSRTPAHNTEKAIAVKNKCALWSHAWPRLPVEPISRAAWERYALTLSHPLSGFNAYLGEGLSSDFDAGKEATTVSNSIIAPDKARFEFKNILTFQDNTNPMIVQMYHSDTPFDLKVIQVETGVTQQVIFTLPAQPGPTHYVQLRSANSILSGIARFDI